MSGATQIKVLRVLYTNRARCAIFSGLGFFSSETNLENLFSSPSFSIYMMVVGRALIQD